MHPKTKEELAKQGAQIAQAFKWVGGVLVGDGDEVLDENRRVRRSAGASGESAPGVAQNEGTRAGDATQFRKPSAEPRT